MTRITAVDRPPPKTREDLGPKVKAHTRYHLADGSQVPGVTTIVRVLGFNTATLVKWARNEALAGNDPDKIRDETATIGTLAHHFIECELKGIDPQTEDYSEVQVDRALKAWHTFHGWLKHHELSTDDKDRMVEQQLVSELHGYGGTIDCWSWLDGVPTLLDFKTSSGIYFEHRLQVAAYWKLLQEHDYPVKGIRILRIPRAENEDFQEHIITGEQVVTGWRIFKRALEIWRLHKQMTWRA